MPSKHLVDPEFLPFVEQMPPARFENGGLEKVRAMHDEMSAANVPQLRADVERSEQYIPGPEGAPDVRVIIFKPKAVGDQRPAILHIHGGGYVIGKPEMGDFNNMNYAGDFGAIVVSVDYRLAPENPHPAPVEDCYAALSWLHTNAVELGVNRENIAISGESAGGGLAAALALLARDRKEVPIAFQHLIFPMLDDRTTIVTDPSPYIGQFVWTPQTNQFGWSALLGKQPGGPDISPYAAAARAEDLAGLPPTYIICGALDLFLEENIDYATRLIRAGVPTEMHVYPGAPHGFMMVPHAAVSKTFHRDSMAALKRALCPI